MDDRLYRSRTDRMIAGVAGGLAERYDLDPSLVRIAWALVILGTGGLFFLLYIVMIIVVPEEPSEPTPPMAPVGTEASMPQPTLATEPAPAGGGPEPSPTDVTTTGSASALAATSPPPTSGGAPTTGAAPAMSSRDARRAARRERRDNNGPLIVGGILVIVGILAFAGQVVPGLDWDLIWPIGLIVLGVALVIGATRRRPSA
jgi:phage shock protein PspC (stress-responsive transcriptional regulator)